jgi:hypothetical protein
MRNNFACWTVNIVATAHGYQRRGIALSLKRYVLALAREASVPEVLSNVHFDNDAMQKLNAKLGAQTRMDPNDRHSMICRIDPQK